MKAPRVGAAYGFVGLPLVLCGFGCSGIRYRNAYPYLIRRRREYDSGAYAAARADFNEAIRRDYNIASAHCYLGLSDRKLGDLETAQQELEAAVKLAPGATWCHVYLGLVYYDAKKFSEAKAEA
jgi:tetratricopeptide (TPR) repeat protein